MVTTGKTERLEGLAQDFYEDIATRWVPDVLGNFDMSECLQTPSLTPRDVQFVDVPKSDRTWRAAPVLNIQAMRALRDAVSELRLISESVLDPAVCGYRTGSTSGSAYSDEYMRFRSISNGLAESYDYVVIADVKNFFDSVDVNSVSEKMLETLGDPWRPISELLVKTKEIGIEGLPAGYGDARLVANHLLRWADATIGCSFARWVDDYRIYANTLGDAERAVQRLSESLEELGLRMNDRKLEFYRSEEYLARRHGPPLESVYHPNSESHKVVRASLRTVFFRAVNDGNRRLLRFSLPRLAEQGDPIAVDYAINEIKNNSIDTPRLVLYIGNFLRERSVQERLESLVLTSNLSHWTMMRLAPLLCSMQLERCTLNMLGESLSASRQPALWGSLLRVLAIHGQKDLVFDEVTRCQPLDPRAAIGAFLDIGCAIPNDLRAMAPQTAKAADHVVAVPRPSTYTLL